MMMSMIAEVQNCIARAEQELHGINQQLYTASGTLSVLERLKVEQRAEYLRSYIAVQQAALERIPIDAAYSRN